MLIFGAYVLLTNNFSSTEVFEIDSMFYIFEIVALVNFIIGKIRFSKLRKTQKQAKKMSEQQTAE